MVPGCGSGGGGAGGDSSESHDTDPTADDLDSPPSVRRRNAQGTKISSRPHSDLLNQILIDKFKVSERGNFFYQIHVDQFVSDSFLHNKR